LPDTEENGTNGPTAYNGVTFALSDPALADSLGFGTYPPPPDLPGNYEDQEVRCRTVETQIPETTYPEKDWSACADNPKW
jgi:hypothetical protein